MVDELQKKLADVAFCMDNTDEEQAVFILLMSLKKYDADIWLKQIGTLFALKERVSNIPLDDRRIVHSLLEQTIMACIDKSLYGDLKLSLNDFKKILDAQPDYPGHINAQEALKYKLGKIAINLAEILSEDGNSQDALFFLTHAQFRNMPLSAEEKLLADKIQRDNQLSTGFMENFNG